MAFDLMKLAKLAPLLPKRLDELSVEELKGVQTVLGVEADVTEELKAAALALFQGKNLNTVADMIQSPESIKQLVLFLKRGLTPEGNAEEFDQGESERVSAMTLNIHHRDEDPSEFGFPDEHDLSSVIEPESVSDMVLTIVSK